MEEEDIEEEEGGRRGRGAGGYQSLLCSVYTSMLGEYDADPRHMMKFIDPVGIRKRIHHSALKKSQSIQSKWITT